MKKWFIKVLTFLILLVSVSCQEIVVIYPSYPYREQPTYTTNGEIQFGNYSSASPKTKAMAGEGPNAVGYGSFDIFAFEDNTVIMDPYKVNWNGSAWVYEGIGTQELKYFSRTANQYSFIGVISDRDAYRDGTTIKVDNVEAFQTDDEMNSPKEFLYTQQVVNQADFGKYVNLTFNHLNARMFIGFASDRNDTQIIDYAPATSGQTAVNDTLFVQKFGAAGFYNRNSDSQPVVGLTDEMISYLNSMYSLDGTTSDTWPSSGTHTLKINTTNIPNTYKLNWEIGTSETGIYNITFFDDVKYLQDNNITIPSMWTNLGPIVHLKKNDNGTYTAVILVVGSLSGNPNSLPIITEVIPAIPASEGLKGIRVFSVDDSGSPITHKVHVDSANVHIGITGSPILDNLAKNSNVMIFNIPSGNVYQSADNNITWAQATHSSTIRYALPVENTGYVVKFSYTYNGVNYYDSRVLIPTASADFVSSKNYTYVIYITDKTNGTTDPDKAKEDKNEVDTSNKAIVFSQITFGEYADGAHYVYTVQ